MSKENQIPRTMAKAAKIAGHHFKDVEEMALDTGRKIMRDQTEWLDKVMQDLLPPNLYEAGRHGDMEKEISEYVSRHKIRVIYIPDTLRLRVMLGDNVHAEFRTQLTVDGEPVEMKPTMPLDGSQN